MFRDRKDGGIQLAEALAKYKNKDVVVLGIPRGGAETAYYVAQYLHADFSLLVSRKLGFPENPELAFGAIAEDGSVYLNPYLSEKAHPEMIASVSAAQKHEIERRIRKLRGGKPLPDLKDKIVLLVDDGIATGATLFAAIALCRNKLAKKIVVAAPISGMDTAAILEEEADEVVILEMPENFRAVSQGYENFYNLSDAEVTNIMQLWEQEHPPA